jgi:pyridoxine 5-phosphate synthase
MNHSIIRLGVNIDHVATLRQQRAGRYPDPVQAAMQAALAGADGITLHLREDRRHIQDRDLQLLQALTQVPINLEMSTDPEVLEIAKKIKPAHCCLVPEKRQELTTEGGLDVMGQESKIKNICADLAKVGIEVSLFIEADLGQIAAAKRCGAPVIELHTGAYADAATPENETHELEKITEGALYAHQQGLIVNAGHGLHYHNVQAIAAISIIRELNIGHSIVAHAIFVGLTTAVKEMKALMHEARLFSLES